MPHNICLNPTLQSGGGGGATLLKPNTPSDFILGFNFILTLVLHLKCYKVDFHKKVSFEKLFHIRDEILISDNKSCSEASQTYKK